MSLYAFHLGQIISTVIGQVDHGGEDGNAARIRDDNPCKWTYLAKFATSFCCLSSILVVIQVLPKVSVISNIIISTIF